MRIDPLLLLATIFAISVDSGSADYPIARTLATWIGVLILAGATGAAVLVAQRAARIEPPNRLWLVQRRVRRRLGWLRIGSMLNLVVAVGVFGWDGVVRETLGLGRLFVVDEIVIIAPLIVMLAILTLADRAWDDAFDVRADRDEFLARMPKAIDPAERFLPRFRDQYALLLVTFVVLTVFLDVMAWADPLWQQHPITLAAGMAGMGLVVVVGMPAVIRGVLPTRSIPPSPSRQLFEGWLRTCRVRVRDILEWKEGRGLVNAMAVGLFPSFRYIVMTSALLEVLGPLERLAVFGHEVGHLRHRHLLWLTLITIGGPIAVGMTLYDLLHRLGPVANVEGNAAIVVLPAVIMILIIPPIVLRLFERQADLDGCQALSAALSQDRHLFHAGNPAWLTEPLRADAIQLYVGFLHQIAFANDQDPSVWTWRHGRLIDRIRFLESVIERPERADRFHRRLAWIRYSILSVTALGPIILWISNFLH